MKLKVNKIFSDRQTGYLISLVCILFVSISFLIILEKEIAFSRDRFLDKYKKNSQVSISSPQEALVYLLGEFRSSIADILWLKVDKYFHAGFEREHMLHEIEHPYLRKYLKEAEIQLYKEHISQDWKTEFMPLIRLVTYLDPHFIQAYTVGAWWLTYKLDKPEQAIKFLLEGISHNTTAYELYYEMSWIYFKKYHDYQKAIEWLYEAMKYASAPEEKVKLLELLAFSYERLQQNELAKRYFKEIVRLGIEPQASTARRFLAE